MLFMYQGRKMVKHKQKIQHFPSSGTYCVASDIFVLVPLPFNGNEDIVVINNSYSKVAGTTFSEKASSIPIVTKFLNDSEIPFCTSTFGLTETKLKVASNVFPTMSFFVEIAKLTTTANQEHSNGSGPKYTI